jgi:hypothetical protein
MSIRSASSRAMLRAAVVTGGASVDVVIALSVVFVGAVALFRRPSGALQWRLFGGAVFGFGLIHGMGLSTRLQDIDVFALSRVIAFNIGIELGQLIAIGVMTLVGAFLTEDDGARYRSHWAPGLALMAVGALAAGGQVVGRATEPEAPVRDTAAVDSRVCTVGERTEPVPAGRGGPFAKEFFEPTETTPEDDFDRALGNGLVLVRYRPDLPAEQVTRLREFVVGPDGRKVVGGPMPQQVEAVTAMHRFETITCTELDLPALKEFAHNWLADPRSRTR